MEFCRSTMWRAARPLRFCAGLFNVQPGAIAWVEKALAQQNPMLAQKAKQGQQRQTQYRRLIAFNPVK
jgi:hypothetical protein